MDQPTTLADRTPVPQELSAAEKATDKQLTYIVGLIADKDIACGALTDAQIAYLRAGDFSRLTKEKASSIIQYLKPLPAFVGHPMRHQTSAALPAVPAGRYAIENEQGELRFYKVWVSPDGHRTSVYVQHSSDQSKLYYTAAKTVLGKILDVGVRECAIRYGMEIGSCSNCGRTLTNTISRELGIGPICGGRMFGDDFKAEVNTKRAEIVARGEDPDK